MILHYRERDIPLLVAEIAALKQTVVELRADRMRMRALFTSIANGCVGDNDSNCVGYALSYAEIEQIAHAALASPPAAEEPKLQKRTKGSYGAECNRASCKTVLATWKHRDMDRYYCSACGMWINENNSDCDPPLCGPVSGDAT